MSRRARRSLSGYSLVILMVIITAMSVMVAAALPAIDTQIQRDKEEELIFRGFQYAEAIRVFQRRFGRYPVRLDELVEARPRCLRQLWKDPMTEKGEWGLILANQPQVPGGRRLPPGQRGTPVADGRDPSAPQNPQVPAPIVGVFSQSDKPSIKVLFGQQRYNDWKFTAQQVQNAFAVVAGNNIPRSANATWIGRPFEGQGGTGPGLGVPGMPPAGGKPGEPPHPLHWPPPQPPPKTPDPTSDVDPN